MSSHQPLKGMKEAHKIAFQESIPWYATIELGLQCNLTCMHCYNFDRTLPIPEKFKKNITPERIFKLIEELKEAGTIMIAFSGGEAIMHPHLFSFIKAAREHNLLVKIKSNGTKISKSVALKIKNHEVYGVDISVYGVNSEEHDYLTRTPGSFQKTIEGIKNLRELEIPVELNFIIYKKNFRSVEKMIELAHDLNCQYSLSPELTARYDDTTLGNELNLSEDDYRELLNSKVSEYFMTDNSDKSLQCECARTVCAINTAGDVYPCIGAPVYSGNIEHTSFGDIWKNSTELNKIRNLVKNDFKKCIDCNLITTCSRSSGAAFINTGEYTGPNPQNCLEAKIRKEITTN
jgi:radical SAM protein with 4Fe4S-binding SPASM domain